MISVVLDTNVFISAFVFGGIPRQVVRLAETGAFTLAVSEAIRAETEQVLALKFRWPQKRVAQACGPTWAIADVIVTKTMIEAADDPDDNRILECAWDARSAVIVTGDRDLLRLNPYRSIAIATPAEFLRRRLWHDTRSRD